MRGGMVVSPHPAASEAARDVLAASGDAISAAIACNAVLSVVYPHFCGIGGDAVWLVSDGQGGETCFLGIGQGIGSAEIGDTIPTRGPGSILTTAAVVDCWDRALTHARSEWGAGEALADLLAPAIDLAQSGHEVSRSMLHWLAFRDVETADWPGFDALFRPNGHAPEAGDVLRQPALAESLSAIARDGARSFYEGPLSKRIVAGLGEAGARLSADDLAATRTRVMAPLRLDYRGATLLAPPPPTQGLTTLQIMSILRAFDFDTISDGSSEHLHLVVEAVKRAFLDRSAIADPDHSSLDPSALLSAPYLAAKARSIGDAALAWPPTFQPADTVYFGVVDGAGRCASVLQSIYYDWGSGVVAGDTGIIWQNRGAAFDPDPTRPNGYRPGKLPFYTLNPGLALKGGKPWLLYGTQGADGQPQTLAMLLTRLIDFGMSPADALAGGRFLLGRTFSDSRDTLKLEGQIDAKITAKLAERGHEIAPIPAFSPLAGQAGAIRIDADGTLDGAHDPRGDGTALRA